MQQQQLIREPREISVVGREYCLSYPVRLTMQRKSPPWPWGLLGEAAGSDFVVKDGDGRAVLAVEGRLRLSLRQWRILRTPAGATLVTMRTQLFSIHEAWDAFRGSGRDGSSSSSADFLFTASKDSILPGAGPRPTLNVFLSESASRRRGAGSGAGTRAPDFKVVCGSPSNGGVGGAGVCSVYQGARLLAEKRPLGLGDGTCSVVTVFPWVDYAFVVVLLVLLDELTSRSGFSLWSSDDPDAD